MNLVLKNLFFFVRPLSLHLLIYKAEYSSLLSILHRISGLFLGFLLLFSFFVFYFLNFFCSMFSFHFLFYIFNLSYIYFILFFFLYFHFFNGLRHIFWDLGFGLSKKFLIFSGQFIFFVSFGLLFLVAI